MFYVLRQCLGQDVYIQSIHQVWVKVYSRLLRTIVPVAIALELKGNRSADGPKERPTIRASYMFSQAQTMAFSQAQAAAGASEEEPDKDDGIELKSEKIRTGENTRQGASIRVRAT